MSGTVNISRDIWQDTAFKAQPFTEREAFVWLIMEASYRPRQKRIGNVSVDLERGQLASSVRFMAEAWSWQKSTVDRFLKRLENRDMIGTDSGTGISVITICKYNEYQNATSDSGTDKFEKRDSSGTAAGQQRDKPNKGLIPDAIKKEEAKASSAISHPEVSQHFADFWDAYPHRNGQKKNRKGAEVAFAKVVKSGVDVAQIAAGVASMRNAPDVLRGFARDPTTWLNQQGWTDEIPEQTSFSNGSHYDQRTANNSPAQRRPGSGSGTIDAFAAVAARYGDPSQRNGGAGG